MRRDLAGIDEGNPLSRGPSGPLRSSKSGKPEAKRMDSNAAFGEEENPLSRGPIGPLRSSKSGKTAAAGNTRLTTIAAK